jgi:hypothetical protein
MEEQAVLRHALSSNAPTPAKGEIPVDAIAYAHELNETETNLPLSEEREDPSDMEEVPVPDEYKYQKDLLSIDEFKNPRSDLGNPNSIDYWVKLHEEHSEKSKLFANGGGEEGKLAFLLFVHVLQI